jgi:hypothetical protein
LGGLEVFVEDGEVTIGFEDDFFDGGGEGGEFFFALFDAL